MKGAKKKFKIRIKYSCNHVTYFFVLRHQIATATPFQHIAYYYPWEINSDAIKIRKHHSFEMKCLKRDKCRASSLFSFAMLFPFFSSSKHHYVSLHTEKEHERLVDSEREKGKCKNRDWWSPYLPSDAPSSVEFFVSHLEKKKKVNEKSLEIQ